MDRLVRRALLFPPRSRSFFLSFSLSSRAWVACSKSPRYRICGGASQSNLVAVALSHGTDHCHVWSGVVVERLKMPETTLDLLVMAETTQPISPPWVSWLVSEDNLDQDGEVKFAC